MSSNRFREVPLRALSSLPIRNGAGEKGLTYDPKAIRYVRTTDILSPHKLKSETKRSIDRAIGEKYSLEIGDLLFTAAGATIGKSYLHLAEVEDCCFAGFLVRVRPENELVGRYLSYWSQSTHFHNQIWAGAVVSTIPNFSASRYRGLRAPIPISTSDVQLIVRYLDHAELRIAKAIAAKTRLLRLLAEQKQVIVEELVLRGGSRTDALRDSGQAWMGPIPSHWEVVPSKSLFGHRRERARPGDEMLTASQAHGIINRDEFMEREGRRVMVVQTGADILKHVEPNDFVISMRSFQGGIEWSKVRGMISSAYVMLPPAARIHCPYFAFLLKSTSYISALRATSDLVRDGQALRYSNFCQIQLPLPPVVEQEEIAKEVEVRTSSIGASMISISREIALLKEYRTRLISDVVTGKLDVRAEAAKLPVIDPEELAELTAGAGLAAEDDVDDE
jgi:restriction endonuclease S subunit